ncbi:MAG: HEAT repeat domain-containing protein [Gemmatimonadales bacterium]|jgi:hypothetical protein
MKRIDSLLVGVTVALTSLPLATPAVAQGIAERVAAVDDGQVRLSFTAREGVCGDGESISMHRRGRDCYCCCEPGPVRVAIDKRDGRIVEIDTYVGGRWRARAGRVEDLGTVAAPEAARYFLSLAARLDGETGRDAIFPATIADSAVVWPELLALAKDRTRPREVREGAVFWVAQQAGAVVTQGLEEIVADEDDDIEVREHAVFAISQLPDEEGVPALIRLVRGHADPRIRRQAVFWLGQSGDPRALDLFEEILTRR